MLAEGRHSSCNLLECNYSSSKEQNPFSHKETDYLMINLNRGHDYIPEYFTAK